MSFTLTKMLSGEKSMRDQGQFDTPLGEIKAQIGTTYVSATNNKKADWKQINDVAGKIEKKTADVKEQWMKMKVWLESPWRSNAVKASPEKAAKRKATTDKPAKKAKVTASGTITAASGAITASGTSTAASGAITASGTSTAASGTSAAASGTSTADTVTITKDQATQMMQMMLDMKQRLKQPMIADAAPGIDKVEKLAIQQYKEEHGASIRTDAALLLYQDEEFKKDPEVKKYVARLIVNDYQRNPFQCPMDVKRSAAYIYMKKHRNDPDFVDEAMKRYPPSSDDDEDEASESDESEDDDENDE
jgi:hypothetical protein